MKKEEREVCQGLVKDSLTKYLISRAYSCACAHGFHNVELSVEHCLMLVLSEIGEAVEADRKWCRRADVDAFEFREVVYPTFGERFEKYIKDTLEDELADVCIRLYDMCGAFEIEPRVEYESMQADFKDIFGEDSFCERMFYLSRLLCLTNSVMEEDGTDECLPQTIGQALSFVFACAHDMGIDLLWHIEQKMTYNEQRPMLNGKRY